MTEPAEKLLEVNNLKKYFNVGNGKLHAVDELSFYINRGETLGLVGESGCGKSTTGRTLIRLITADSGEILFDGENILDFGKHKLKELRSRIQMVFQDPYSSLDPRKNLMEIISEPLTNLGEYRGKSKKEERVRELMDIVGLSPRLINSYPHELDGGRRQRVGVARALSVNPEFIVLDEPVSALDVCIQAQIINLLKRLQKDLGLSYLFISHDLSVVKHISDRIAVMYLGKIVELCDFDLIFVDPLHPYTQALLSAIPIPRIDIQREELILVGDVPSPVDPPAGCRFAGRCIYVQDICRRETPELRQYATQRYVACHFAGKLERTVVNQE
jgi:oligopeptide/dipeptide ABC transporter ATP-binding protein